jgi:hypothetical protein
MPLTYMILLFMIFYILGKWAFFVFTRRKQLARNDLDTNFTKQLKSGERHEL